MDAKVTWSKRLSFVGEGLEAVVQFVDTFRLTFPIWLDPEESTLRTLNSFSLPYSIVN